MAREQRRLAAVLSADVVGYSRLMGRDESGTLTRLREHRSQRLEPTVTRHGGRLVKLTGDGALIEFPSAVDALGAAIAFQQAMSDANQGQPDDSAIVFRIGLHLGDLIVDGDDLYGDGVNIAARLEAAAPAGGIVISGSVHEATVGRLEATFEDLGRLTLKNIERPIQAFGVKWDAVPWKVPEPTPAGSSNAAMPPTYGVLPTVPDKPSIAVLPFQNMSGDAEQEYFVDGLVEDIITALSRFRSLFVIARNSSFSYKGKSPDIRQVGRELGVRYVLEGSVRKAGNRLRITGQLIQADTGAHIWADRYDGDITDIFDLQDKVTIDVVGAIAPKLESAEIERARRKPTENLDAYDCYLRSVAIGYLGRDKLGEARQWCARALELDPDYAVAHSFAAALASRGKGLGLAFDEASAAETLRLARRAVELDREDSFVLALAGWVFAFVGSDLSAASSLLRRALAIHPNLAQAWVISGWLNVWEGNPDVAIDHFERAIRFSPLDPNIAQIRQGSAHAHFMARHYDEALTSAEAAITDRQIAPNYRIAAASAALAGQPDRARKFTRLLLAVDPGRSLSNLEDVLGPYRRPQDIARYREGLRLAGLPE